MKIITFFGKLAVCIIIIIVIEGIGTLGMAFHFESYGPIAWTFQSCLILVAAWIATLDWK